jgi:hypothetical protein
VVCALAIPAQRQAMMTGMGRPGFGRNFILIGSEVFRDAGREVVPAVQIDDQLLKPELPSVTTFDGFLTMTYPDWTMVRR